MAPEGDEDAPEEDEPEDEDDDDAEEEAASSDDDKKKKKGAAPARGRGAASKDEKVSRASGAGRPKRATAGRTRGLI